MAGGQATAARAARPLHLCCRRHSRAQAAPGLPEPGDTLRRFPIICKAKWPAKHTLEFLRFIAGSVGTMQRNHKLWRIEYPAAVAGDRFSTALRTFRSATPL